VEAKLKKWDQSYADLEVPYRTHGHTCVTKMTKRSSPKLVGYLIKEATAKKAGTSDDSKKSVRLSAGVKTTRFETQ
jgi:hypothetical protein